MLRLRVWRLYQPLTLLGLEMWQLFVGMVAMVLGLQLGGMLPHPALGLVLAGAMGYAAIKFSDGSSSFTPGEPLAGDHLANPEGTVPARAGRGHHAPDL
jgi:hypothetical protein